MATANTGEQSQASQSNSQLSTLNPQLPETLNSQLTEKAAVQIDAERLKFIDELSRLILELKKQFPEIAQSLLKTRDNVPANLENIPIKDLMNLLRTVQQNLNVLADTANATTTANANVEKAEIAEKIKNLVGEIIKILQPNSESPPENKLLQALSKNDFASANIAIKTIVEANIAQIPKIPQATQTPQQPVQTAVPQQPVQAAVPQQPVQAAVPQQPVQAAVPQQPVQTAVPQQPVQVALPQQPVQAAVSPQPVQAAVPQQPVQAAVSPQPVQAAVPPQPVQAAVPQQPVQAAVPQQPVQTTLPTLPVQTLQTPQVNTQNTQQAFQIIYNALQELKILGIPKELQKAPLKELEVIALQKIGIDIPEIQKNLVKNLSAVFSEKPVFAVATTPPPTGANVNTHIQIHTNINANTNINTNTHINANNVFEIPLPKNFPLQIPPNRKVEMAFTLYQVPQNPNQNQSGENKFVLQPWPASTQIPKEERNFWIKTDLPFTPQILNVREAILSFGKLPENPETVKLFASGMHELSLRTEHGANVSKEQANLLWRVVQRVASEGSEIQRDNVPKPVTGGNQAQAQTQTQTQVQVQTQTQVQVQTEKYLPPQITQTLLKYQPLGNHEGDLFKNLPEPVKRELLQELPAGKTWQPETLQKAVEKTLEKYIEPPQAVNSNEHAAKAHEEIKSSLQNLKEQIQWTRIDQDTRLQNDKENVFYFMHEGELQKGRLKVKDERKGGSKKHQDSSISFSIETNAKNLGKVHADLTLSRNILNIRLQDEIGAAGDAIKGERETLAKELADIGINLGELLYGKTPKIQNLPIAKKEGKSSGGLDVRA